MERVLKSFVVFKAVEILLIALGVLGGVLVFGDRVWETVLDIDALNKAGYTVKTGGSATLSGVALENGKWLAGMP